MYLIFIWCVVYMNGYLKCIFCLFYNLNGDNLPRVSSDPILATLM